LGDGFGVRVIIGEGLGVGHGVGAGEGMGVVTGNTFQIHVCIVVPFSLDATADTFHVPVTALVFV